MPPTEPEKRPTAFVSYAQSSRSWQKTVLDFTTALRDPGGVDAELDLFHGADHQRWTDFGSNLIEESDFTLIAIDAAYKRRWLGRERKGVGAGAAREAATIKAIFEEDQRDFVRRIKIVLLPGSEEDDIPDMLRGHCERFKIGSFDEEGLEPLLRSLWGRPAIPKPPLGPIPALPPKAYANLKGQGDREAKLRGRLKGVQARLERARSRPSRSGSPRETSDLEQEQAALEVSLEALADAQAAGGRRQRWSARRSRLAVSTIAGAGLVAAVLLSGGVVSDSGEPLRRVSATVDGLTVEGPSGWTRDHAKALVGGLELGHPIDLTAGAGGKGQAVAGISEAVGPTLLPVAYRKQIDGGSGRTALGLGALQAYRYRGLKSPGGGGPMTIYAAPTSLGVAILACRVPEGEEDPAAARRCAQIAATMKLTRGSAYRLGTSGGLARVLRRRLRRLSERRRSAMRQLSRATEASRQAVAAESLADAFRDAAAGVAAVRISPESTLARRRVLAALRSARDAYRNLAVSARKENGSRYDLAAGAAEHAELALGHRLAAMERLGYRVGSGQSG